MLQSDACPQPSPWRRELPQRRVGASSWAGARQRCCGRRRQLHGGPVPRRTACQGTATEDGSVLPCTRQANPEQLRDPAMIGGTATSTVRVQDACGSESLDAYMRLPPEAYSQLMPGMISPLGGNRFLLHLPRISFFKVWVAPEVEVQARLLEGPQPCVLLESCACRLPGSPLFASLEDRFAMRFRTKLSWSPAWHSTGAAGDAAVQSVAGGNGLAAAAAAEAAPSSRIGRQQRSRLMLTLPWGLTGLFRQRNGSKAEPSAAASGSNSTRGDSDASQEATPPELNSEPRPQPSSSNNNGSSNGSNGAGSKGSSSGEGAAWDASLAAPSLLEAELAQADEPADGKLGARSPSALATTEIEAGGNSFSPSEEGKKGQGRIVGDLMLEVWSEVPPPLHLLPRSVVEGTGNAVLRGLIRTLLPLFMRRLGEDYQLWSKDPAYRESKAQVAALGQAGQAANGPRGEAEPEAAGEPIVR